MAFYRLGALILGRKDGPKRLTSQIPACKASSAMEPFQRRGLNNCQKRGLTFRIPNTVIVADTSNMPHNCIGICFGLYAYIYLYVDVHIYIYIQKTAQYGPQFWRIQFSGVFHVLDETTPHLMHMLAIRVMFFIYSH